MKLRTILLSLLAAVAAFGSPINEPPPLGAILDLSGSPIPGNGNNTLQLYSISFTATLTSTVISFAIREDPAFISLENTTLVDVTEADTPVASYLNGNFSAGTYTSNGNASAPVDWVFSNVFNASFSGQVLGPTACAGGAASCWYDGSVQAYDEISQTVSTVVGDTYQISFQLGDNSGGSTFSSVSTNGDTVDTGGNGIDLLVYAQANIAPLPGNVPEPATFVLVGLGLAAAALYSARRKRKLEISASAA